MPEQNEIERETEETLEKIKEAEVHLDQIRGCLVGGAIGDALGYPVEFWDEQKIIERYGDKGISEYSLDSKSGKALISDDTQMTLFTAFYCQRNSCRRYPRTDARNPERSKVLCGCVISGLASDAGNLF